MHNINLIIIIKKPFKMISIYQPVNYNKLITGGDNFK